MTKFEAYADDVEQLRFVMVETDVEAGKYRITSARHGSPMLAEWAVDDLNEAVELFAKLVTEEQE